MESSARSYREANISDLPGIVKIHQASFPQFFMTLLGPRFLERYYHLVMAYTGRIFLVKQSAEGLEGFVCGFLDPERFYMELRAHRWSLLGSMMKRVVSRPWLIPKLLASYAQARRSSREGESEGCELSSIAVLPCLSGRGIGKGLVQAFLEAARGKARSIVLTTDADGNDPVNAFYQGLGFTLIGTYERSKGRRMNKYRQSLDI